MHIDLFAREQAPERVACLFGTLSVTTSVATGKDLDAVTSGFIRMFVRLLF